jgi:hypothetical protein
MSHQVDANKGDVIFFHGNRLYDTGPEKH